VSGPTSAADAGTHPAALNFTPAPDSYRHWRLTFDGLIATLAMDVTPDAGLSSEYELKLNSYDLSVDIELNAIVQRLRFEHPEVKAVVLTGALDKVFCAGANIQMLANASHVHKVNFCKFTNETRNAIEESTALSEQTWIAAVNGSAAGGGYELALACDEIVLVDDRASTVSLPEVPLLGVLPGTGGLTRLVDKRHVRRDLADAFATKTEGIKGQQALDWLLVDAIAPRSAFESVVLSRAEARAARSDRPTGAAGITLNALDGGWSPGGAKYANVGVRIDRELGSATLTVHGPRGAEPADVAQLVAAGATAWIVAAARELDDAILHLRFDEPEIGTWVLRTEGVAARVIAAEALLAQTNWLARETRLLWARTLKRLDVSSRTLVTLIEPGSCFAGVLAELALAADRSLVLDGAWERTNDPPPTIRLTDANDGWFPRGNGLSRGATRFWGRPDALDRARALIGSDLDASAAVAAELVTAAFDDLDWDDEVRLLLEERNSFSPDALTGMEANFRFAGPETLETKIFARLSAWQNWIFQRPNAVGAEGALQRFGSGSRPTYDRRRV
jgi:benzoyl-CoA-dihydrodiol lyase